MLLTLHPVDLVFHLDTYRAVIQLSNKGVLGKEGEREERGGRGRERKERGGGEGEKERGRERRGGGREER